jgi:hypothetical protein
MAIPEELRIERGIITIEIVPRYTTTSPSLKLTYPVKNEPPEIRRIDTKLLVDREIISLP